MDIDPLWVLGGCRFNLSSNCMAEIKIPPSSPRENYTKSHPFLLFLSFLFIFLLLARPADQIRNSNMVTEPVSQTLPTPTTSSSLTVSSLQPKKSHNEKTLPSKQFETSEHEVPSGPNPISNR